MLFLLEKEGVAGNAGFLRGIMSHQERVKGSGMKEIKISVRSLIEFVLREGDIRTGTLAGDPKRMLEGTRAHQRVQRQRMAEDSAYEKEQYFKLERDMGGFRFLIDGRADGLVRGTYIEEIKSTYLPLEELEEDHEPLHWAQVMLYGYMHLMETGGETLRLVVTYVHLETEAVRSFSKTFTRQVLTDFVEDVVERYHVFVSLQAEWVEERTRTLKALEFPFSAYREGQRDLAVDVYNTIRQTGKLFVQAPTGIGKTISTVYPTLKAMGEGMVDRIFYLTAKGTLKTVAEETMALLSEREARIRPLTITSKEKICLNGTVDCNPEKCPYAKGHYDRINPCLLEMMKRQESQYTRETIVSAAKEHKVCPFELSLDLALFSDVIICDYNYVFDPRVYLRRFFLDVRENYVFLVDEAHNLVDRSRDMYSAALRKSQVMDARKVLENGGQMRSALNRMNKAFLAMRKGLEETEEGSVSYHGVDGTFLEVLRQFILAFEVFNKEHPEDFQGREVLLELFFAVGNFLSIQEDYDEGYITYEEKLGADVTVKLFCIQPAERLKTVFQRARASVLFSATLSPMPYYIDLLGGVEADFRKSLPSPFPRENLEVFLDSSIDTRFHQRAQSYEAIAANLEDMVCRKPGNYIAFFPSYKYMNAVHEAFLARPGLDCDVWIQEPNLEESAREAVVESFSMPRSRSYLAFMVLGGIFSEGIDLRGERLIGVAVTGVGYPQISFERDLIRRHFQQEGRGFEYAYIYPGIHRVLQGAGRVIRSEADRGMILLMDKRYTWNAFHPLLPAHWLPLKPWKGEARP